MGLLSLILGSENKRNLRQVTKIANRVEELAQKYKQMSDDELKAVTPALKARLEAGESLDSLLFDAFAAVREAADRVLVMRHFFVQLMGGAVLHQGRVAEMKTGEGKTLVATLAAYLNALEGKGVHIVTVNDYLAKRDAEWMGKIYKFMGFSVGCVVPGMSNDEKREAYACDITYCTNNELGFDYLRDNMVIRKEDRVLRDLHFAIVDEVDSILIDEARTPLIISGRGEKSSDLYVRADRFVRTLKRDADFILDEKERSVRITEEGTKKAERFFAIENLGDVENTDLNHHIQQALKANNIFKRDNDYIVSDGEVIIVDEFTGRLMIGRRYSDGLHQAIEAKEGVVIRSENKTLATITFQNFFRLYRKLSGMTGTAKTEEDEFKAIYSLDVMVIPTHKPMIRLDENDAIYKTRAGKLRAIANDIEDCYKRGQPVLVGTLTVERSEELSEHLRKKRIPHHVLNAKNHRQEAMIIAQAGRKSAVTIATNMAGRGTDILLGGNPEYMAKEKLRSLGYSEELISACTSYAEDLTPEEEEARKEYRKYYALFKEQTDKEKEEVIALGGLRVIGTERHESRRIDNQLRGRSGRQGDPGSSIFYISLEDDLARLFGGDRLQGVFNMMNISEDERISAGMVSKSIENAQKRVEGRNFSIRKHVLEYDDVMNTQRAIIYAERNKVLNNEDVHEQVLKFFPMIVSQVIGESIDRGANFTQWDLKLFNRNIENKLLPKGSNFVTEQRAEDWDIDFLEEKLLEETIRSYEEKIERHKEKGMDYHEVERVILLKNIDAKWTEHIDAMDQLRRGISLRAYANIDPVIAYKKEGFEMFEYMTQRIREDTALMLLKLEVENIPKLEAREGVATFANDSQPRKKKPVVRAEKKIGPNEKCPCGSGKKYKNCCG
ncbi:MAG: preprotein translocase subunit SecA [Clostridiales bacterium]|jgi:preprotein translocase subunit SecA|nr:preprotein translocase subunit SecA [Clostridiales bacterium]